MLIILKIILLAAVATMAGYFLTDMYDEFQNPEPTIIGHGSVVAKSNYSDKLAVRAKRQIVRKNVTYWQVETPGGVWLDCAGDCAETYRREVLDFWETQSEGGTGRAGN